MKKAAWLVTPVIRAIFSVLCRIDSQELEKVPKNGPAIVVLNHINFLDAPVIYACLFPRPAIGIAKQETWNNPLFAFLGNVWEAIPLNRNGVDRAALDRAHEALKQGKILVLAPEGTRNPLGTLQQGHPGVVSIALRSGAPIIPLGHTGAQDFWTNMKRFKRTKFHIRVGQPFYLDASGDPSVAKTGTTREKRRKMADEIMKRIALVLPEWQHGVYSGTLFQNSQEESAIRLVKYEDL